MSRNSSQGYSKQGRGDADEAHFAHQAVQLVRLLFKWGDPNRVSSTHLVSISIYPPNSRHGGDFLVVFKGFDQGYRLVAFSRSPNPFTALLGGLQKVADGSIVWKEDAYSMTQNEWTRR